RTTQLTCPHQVAVKSQKVILRAGSGAAPGSACLCSPVAIASRLLLAVQPHALPLALWIPHHPILAEETDRGLLRREVLAVPLQRDLHFEVGFKGGHGVGALRLGLPATGGELTVREELAGEEPPRNLLYRHPRADDPLSRTRLRLVGVRQR